MTGRNPVSPTLELYDKSGPKQLFELGERPMRIGRERGSDIHLDDGLRRVSGLHAQISRGQDGTFYIEDLKSYNQTFLDGRPLTPYVPIPLNDGAKIKICDYTLVFHRAAVEVLEKSSSDPTILNTLDDMSSVSLSARSERAAAVLRAVLEINRILGGATELNEVLGRALSELFSIFRQAENGFILTREPEGKLSPRATRHRQDLDTPLSLSRSVLEHVIRERKGLIISDMDPGSVTITESFPGTGIRTALCVPIFGREGKVIGIIQLDSRLQKVVFGPEDLELLAAVAVPIGVVVENHRLLKERAAYAAAAEVQSALLPRSRPTVEGYAFWEYYQPAHEVGGDYYDYIPVGAAGRTVDRGWSNWALALGDVAGKGMPAALLMASLSAEVRHLVRSGASPIDVARAANIDIYDAGIPGRFVTFLLVCLDAATHQLSVLNAGHMNPIIRRANGSIESISEKEKGTVLGVDPENDYTTAVTRLAPGEIILLYTDGVSEAMNREDVAFGIPAVERVVQTTAGGPAQVGDALLKSVRSHTAGRDQSDDIAILCFGRD